MSEQLNEYAQTFKNMLLMADKIAIDLGVLMSDLRRQGVATAAELSTRLGMSERRTEELMNIGALATPMFPTGRLAEIGLERLHVIQPFVSAEHATALLELAERHTLAQLKEIVDLGNASSGIVAKLRLTRGQLDRVLKGRARESRQQESDADIFKRANRAAAAKLSLQFDPRTPIEAVILPLRIVNDSPWGETERGALVEELNLVLKAALPTLNAELDARPEVAGQVTAAQVYARPVDMPGSGLIARQMGFTQSDNPYPPGSGMHRMWDQDFETPERLSQGFQGKITRN